MNTTRIRTPRVAAAVAIAALMTTVVAVAAPGASDAAGTGHKGDRQAGAKAAQQSPRQAPVKAAADQAKVSWKPMWHSEFGTSADQWPDAWKSAPQASLSDWSVLDRTMVSWEKKSQARYLKRNVDQSGGNLVITTRRVCATKAPSGHLDFSWLKNSQPSVDRCAGKRDHPVYTSGRLQMQNPAFQPTGANVRIDFKATLPTQPATGTRQALWANNATSYCNPTDKVVTNLGEVDALEWYGNAPSGSFSTTHMSCRGTGDDPWQTIRREHRDPVQAGTTHIWSVRKTGNSVSYYLDGQRVEEKSSRRPDSCGTAPFDVPAPADCNVIMNSPWMTILQGEVFKGKFDAGKRQSGPNDVADFAKQQLKVDWVRVYTR
jgi:hypothetical protein